MKEFIVRLITLVILVWIPLVIRGKWGFEVAVLATLAFIWNAIPTASEIRRIVEDQKPEETDDGE